MIRELREYFGISQTEMAVHLCISRSHLSMIESGRRELNSEKHAELLKIFMSINSKPMAITGADNEKAITPQPATDRHFHDCVKLELLTYQHRLLKVKRQIRTLETSRERKAKRFMRMDMLEQEPKQDNGSVNTRTHAKAPPLPGKDCELLKLQIKKCSYEAALKFMEGQCKTMAET